MIIGTTLRLDSWDGWVEFLQGCLWGQRSTVQSHLSEERTVMRSEILHMNKPVIKLLLSSTKLIQRSHTQKPWLTSDFFFLPGSSCGWRCTLLPLSVTWTWQAGCWRGGCMQKNQSVSIRTASGATKLLIKILENVPSM